VKIAIISDIHGCLGYLQRLIPKLRRTDMIFIAGDITGTLSYSLILKSIIRNRKISREVYANEVYGKYKEKFTEFQVKSVMRFFRVITKLRVPIFFTHGNSEVPEVRDLYSSLSENYENIFYLGNTVCEYGKWVIAGYGYCSPASYRISFQTPGEKSKEEILDQLGPEHTFSVECPYGTENERVMEFTLARYEAARNRMPEPFLEELNRWSRMPPGTSEKEYVQWQKGPKSATPIEEMTSWIDTCTAHDNIWLVLVFHGIEGIGWEPVPGNVIETYFNYIKSKEEDIWIATFQDVTKYMRERMHASIKYSRENNSIRVEFHHDLDPELYSLPLTLKTYVPSGWESVKISQGEKSWSAVTLSDECGNYIPYMAYPNDDDIVILKK